MRLAIFIYIISTLIYFLIGDGSMYWALFNMLTMLGIILVLLNFNIQTNSLTKFATNLTIGRIIYSFSCVISPYEWIYVMNKVFATVFFAWLIIVIIMERKTLNGGLR